jgi:hypothetical protein
LRCGTLSRGKRSRTHVSFNTAKIRTSPNMTADTPFGRKHDDRQELLKNWGFQCRCSLCSSPEENIQLSDMRRGRIEEIHAALNDEKGLSQKKISSLTNELLRLIDKEGMLLNLVVYYELIARAYLRIDDFENAKKFVQLAEEWWVHYGGEEHENMEGIQSLWALVREKSRT